VQVRIEGAALAVAKDGAGDLAAGHVAFVDPTAVLMTGEGFQFAESFGDSGFVGGDEPGVAPEERLDRDGLGRVERGIVTGAAGGGHALRELLASEGVVVAGDPFERLIRNCHTFPEPDLRTELTEALAFNFHSLRIVISLPEIFTQGMTENLACPNGHHDSPPTKSNGSNELEIERPKKRINKSIQPVKRKVTKESNFTN
jgi:hypothetical protein